MRAVPSFFRVPLLPASGFWPISLCNHGTSGALPRESKLEPATDCIASTACTARPCCQATARGFWRAAQFFEVGTRCSPVLRLGRELRDPTPAVRRLLQRTDWFTQEKACKLLTAVLGARPSKEIQLANGSAGPSTSSSAAAATSTAPPIVAAASESVQVRRKVQSVVIMQIACTPVRTLCGTVIRACVRLSVNARPSAVLAVATALVSILCKAIAVRRHADSTGFRRRLTATG